MSQQQCLGRGFTFSQRMLFQKAQSQRPSKDSWLVLVLLSNKSVKFKLLWENPSTLADAITVASTEETVRKRYDIHFGSKHTDHEIDQRDEQPMEVEAVRDSVFQM